MLKNIRPLLPLAIFIVIAVFLWKGLTLTPAAVPSPLVGKPVPTFSLPSLFNLQQNYTQKIFEGEVSVFNVWSSTCVACATEHDLLVNTVAHTPNIAFYGLDYRDDPNDAKAWLKQYGNPYQLVLADVSGDAAIDWGVYGTPETFIVDKHARIRYRQIGVIDRDTWQQVLLPLIEKLQHER
jgi:cytochrome c biogenesis protein CcmG/thiol:disulfide interchange protein DsbE